MSDRVAVMYLGQIVELGTAAQVLVTPRHPYTGLLLDSVPRTGEPLDENRRCVKRISRVTAICPRGAISATVVRRPRKCERPQPLQPSHEGRSVRCWRNVD